MYNKIVLHTSRQHVYQSDGPNFIMGPFIRAEQLNVGPINIALKMQDTAWSNLSYGTIREACVTRICILCKYLPYSETLFHNRQPNSGLKLLSP